MPHPAQSEIDEPHGHVVQLYGEDEQLLHRSVSRYLGQALSRDDGVLVIASPEHRNAFVCRLSDEGCDPVSAIRTGRLVLLDAEEMLSRFMVDGQPDWPLFEAAAGDAIRAIQTHVGHPRLAAYGEMVGVLWRNGQRAAAVALEEHWNRLLAGNTVSLFCAYPIDVFGPQFDAETLDPLLCTHKHLVSGGDDLQRALDQAIADIVGAESAAPAGVQAKRATWGSIPKPEEMVLWLRASLPEHADAILERARYYQSCYLHAG